MNKYTPLYGNPAGSADYADRLFGTARVDVVQGMHSNPVETETTINGVYTPNALANSFWADTWRGIIEELESQYGVVFTSELFEQADSAKMEAYISDILNNGDTILTDDETLDVYVTDLADLLGLEHAEDSGEYDIESEIFNKAIDITKEEFPNSEDTNDLIATIANTLSELKETTYPNHPLPFGVIAHAIHQFKSLGFPDYSPEELIELITLSLISGGDKLISDEIESMLTDDLREDSICSSEANNLILAQFGADAAASHEAFCALSSDERVDAYNAAEGNLAILFGIPQTDWDNFVLEGINNTVSAKMLELEGEELRQEIATIVDQAVKDPAKALETRTDTVISGSKVTSEPMTTTHKVVSGLAIAGALVGSLYYIKKVREF